MQAREKRKYFLESMRQALLPREFFIKNECLWYYHKNEPFVISISCDLDKFGGLNEIDLCYGTVFAPISFHRYSTKKLILENCFSYLRYLPVVHRDMVFWQRPYWGKFKECIDFVIPHYQRDVISNIPQALTYENMLSWAEKFYDFNLEWIRYYFCLLNPEELMLAHLYSGNVEYAEHMLQKDIVQYQSMIDMLEKILEEYSADPNNRKRVLYLQNNILRHQEELATLYQHQEMLEKKQYQPLMDIAAQRKEQSEQCLQTFFKRCK